MVKFWGDETGFNFTYFLLIRIFEIRFFINLNNYIADLILEAIIIAEFTITLNSATKINDHPILYYNFGSIT